VLPLDRSLKIGIFLIASAAGAPFAIKLTEIARGDVAFATGLLVLLLLTTIAYLPLVVPLALPNAAVSIWAIAQPLLLTMLLPFALAVSIRALLPSLAMQLGPLIGMSITPVLIVLVVTTAIVNGRAILTVFGTGAIIGAALVIASAFGIGFLLGGFEPGTREEVGLVTAQRNYAAAMIVAAQSVQDRRVLVMVVTAAIVSMAVLFPLAHALGNGKGRRTSEKVGSPGRLSR
jgi:BASS family bile acid:Na+ symporter